jgi:hypothetical protein
MPRVEFESTIPVFERAKTVHALDRAATVIGPDILRAMKWKEDEMDSICIIHCLATH